MIPAASLPFGTPAPNRKFLLAMNLPIDETLFKEASR
jgi:hypothetical protein